MLTGIGKPYVKSLDSRSDLPPDPPYGSNLGHKIADFVFCLISPLFLLLELWNVLRGVGTPYVKSQDSRSDLPRPSIMGQTGVTK